LSDTLGIGVIGAGVMGADHARLIASQVQGARLVGIADADAARAADIARLHNAERHFADGNALIDDPAIDALVIASPDTTHPAYVLAALARGKPVLCEKPLAPSPEECRALVEAEMATGRRLIQVGFMRRFDPPYAAMRAAIRSESLGRPLILHCVHRNVEAPAWFRARNAINNSAVHEMDIVRWLFDEEIVAVTTLKTNGKRDVMPNDPLLLILETASGILVDVEVFINAAYGYEVGAELVCEAGTLRLARPVTAELRHKGQEARPFPPDWRGRFEDAYRLELQAFVDAARKGGTAGASAWDGTVAEAVAEAGVRSLESGRREDVRLAPKPDFYA
jgi:myo-inositol 2-dehydrogenase/D-chiro-inositol 1-dehydrogenase